MPDHWRFRYRCGACQAIQDLPVERIHLDAEPVVREIQQLVIDFGALVRTRDAPGLIAWLARADASSFPEVRSFAAGI